ncbi:glycosyltransferase family 2 protein [Halopseudomonas salina]|nr:glycosyltransferase family 2 protein [Halopseudomonas salina]
MSEEWPRKQARLSIVITTYNYAKVVCRAIDSVASQLCSESELIVIDDGSTDDTASLLAGHILPAEVNAGYLIQPNTGPAAARNRALEYCNGIWVLFLDADDALCPGSIEKICSVLTEHPDTDLLLGGHIAAYPDGREKYHEPSRVASDEKQRLLDYLLNKRISISHGCSIFRTTAVRERPYPEHLRQAEDIAVFAYMLSQPKCMTLQAPLAVIYKHQDSLRNDVSLTIANSALIAETVFESMPDWIQPYRRQYEAKRALSAFRSCYRAARRKDALAYYKKAFKLSPRQAFRWDYLSKWLRLIFATRAKGGASD